MKGLPMNTRVMFAIMAGTALFFVAQYGYAKPGGITGWGGDPRYGYPVATYDDAGHEGTAKDIDINGEVGHPLSVSGPDYRCSGYPVSRSVFATGSGEVISGELPPGLALNANGDHKITGIPTQRGHWIVTMRASGIECDGQSYAGFTQQLRFHITGTGKVIE